MNNLANLAVILNRPKLSENIGTAARAAANMGLGRIILVAPYRFELEIVEATATRAGQELVREIQVAETLEEAVADCDYVVGTTARMGSDRGPFLGPRTLAGLIRDLGPEARVGLLFGPERTGLSTADLRLCQAVVRIPTADPKVSSLNLAQAVLILGYELLLAGEKTGGPPQIKPAPMKEVLAMYDHLERTLLAVGFLPELNPGHWLMSFKRIFNRSGLTHGDCNLLRGMCRQIQWALRTGGRHPGDRDSPPAMECPQTGEAAKG